MTLYCPKCHKRTIHFRFLSDRRASSPQNQTYCSECNTVQEVKPSKIGWFTYDQDPPVEWK